MYSADLLVILIYFLVHSCLSFFLISMRTFFIGYWILIYAFQMLFYDVIITTLFFVVLMISFSNLVQKLHFKYPFDVFILFIKAFKVIFVYPREIYQVRDEFFRWKEDDFWWSDRFFRIIFFYVYAAYKLIQCQWI